MRLVLSTLFMAAAGTMYLGLAGRSDLQSEAAPAAPSVPSVHLASTKLEFDDLLAPGAELRLSEKVLRLDGIRVRLTGFVAKMELPPDGGFYLAPRPVTCDEAGGGTADLPVESVLVLSRSAQGRPVPFIGGALEVTGILQTGNQADADGRVSALRILLDGTEHLVPPVLAAATQ